MISSSNLFEIVFQNNDFLIINKENNLSTQKNSTYKSSIEEKLTLCDYPFSSLRRCGIVHRIDRNTTGLIIVAKNENAFSLFEKLFKERKIKKTYLSLHKGVPENDYGEIKFYQKKVFTKKKMIQMKIDPSIGKLVTMSFRLVETRNYFSLLEVFPITGRTHQIRLAFHKIKFPIYNDPVYNDEKPIDDQGQYLHAWKLSFIFKKEYFEFKAKIPAFFQYELDKLEITTPQ